jgi:ATP-dependent Clp protease ATP-binding subunit ClpA
LPDKAVDLIDESASYLKITLEDMPPILQETHAKIMRLKLKKKRLKKETTKAKDRVKEIEKEIADLKEQTSEIELKWKNEKEILTDIKNIKKQLGTRCDLKLNRLKLGPISAKLPKFATANFLSLKKIWSKIKALEETPELTPNS